MAERWQQWMPFHIDRWKGSPHVQAMKSAARSGYLYLLSSAWQTDNCCLPDDDAELIVLAGMTEDEWLQHGQTIRRRFTKTDAGLRNDVEFAEWNEAKRVFESRQQSARRTNSARSPHDDRTVTARPPSRSADTRTGTGTSTGTKETTKTLASTAVAVPAAGKLVCTLPLNQGDHEVFEADVQGWQALYPAVDVRQELRSIKGWALSNPTRRKTKSGIGRFINSWLSRAQNEAKPGGGNGNRNYSKTGGNIDAARGALAILEQAERDSQAADEMQSEAGGGGESGDLSHLRAGSIEL